MKSLLLFLAILTSFTAATSYAGDSEAHGGHVVVCTKKKWPRKISARILDLYEANKIYGIGTDILRSYALSYYDEQEFIDKALTETRYRASKILGNKHPFLSVLPKDSDGIEIMTTYKSDVILTHDTGDIVYPPPEDCEILQIARKSLDETGRTHLTINRKYWGLLSPYDKYSLILHEVLHSWFNVNTTTLVTRQAVTFLTAPSAFRRNNSDLFVKLVNTKEPIESYRK